MSKPSSEQTHADSDGMMRRRLSKFKRLGLWKENASILSSMLR